MPPAAARAPPSRQALGSVGFRAQGALAGTTKAPIAAQRTVPLQRIAPRLAQWQFLLPRPRSFAGVAGLTSTPYQRM